jgi:hypothetical protein
VSVRECVCFAQTCAAGGEGGRYSPDKCLLTDDEMSLCVCVCVCVCACVRVCVCACGRRG